MEYEFRGLDKYSKEWRYGYYLKGWTQDIISNLGGDYEIIPETTGLYTGLKDKSSKRIYEGDILEYAKGKGVVKWLESHACFCAKGIYGMDYSLWNAKFVKVIDNIHQNPELLEVLNG